jgi:hypothetical protein
MMNIADRAETNRSRPHRFSRHELHEGGMREEHAIANNDFAPVSEIQFRQRHLLRRDVLPHVELRPVRQREDAEVLARRPSAVEQVPQLRSLVARIPLAEIVTMRKHTFLGAGFLFVASCTAESAIES